MHMHTYTHAMRARMHGMTNNEHHHIAVTYTYICFRYDSIQHAKVSLALIRLLFRKSRLYIRFIIMRYDAMHACFISSFLKYQPANQAYSFQLISRSAERNQALCFIIR